MKQFTFKQDEIPQTLLCSLCLKISSNPVFENKTQSMMCLNHINQEHQEHQDNQENQEYQENQFERTRDSKLFSNLFLQTKIICRYCRKEKSYYRFNRHSQKCNQKRKECKDIDLIVNQNYQYQQDIKHAQCNLCEKISNKLKFCNMCDKFKCFSCTQFKQNDECKNVQLSSNQKQIIEEIQLQCKNSLCRKKIKFRNAIQHYYYCYYRIKECRQKDCSWQGYRINYKNHQCIKDLESLQQRVNFYIVNSITNYNKIKFIHKQSNKTKEKIRKLQILQKQMEEQ